MHVRAFMTLWPRASWETWSLDYFLWSGRAAIANRSAVLVLKQLVITKDHVVRPLPVNVVQVIGDAFGQAAKKYSPIPAERYNAWVQHWPEDHDDWAHSECIPVPLLDYSVFIDRRILKCTPEANGDVVVSVSKCLGSIVISCNSFDMALRPIRRTPEFEPLIQSAA